MSAVAVPLADAAVLAALPGLAGWRFDRPGAALRREYRFDDFSAAFGFMIRVALLAERMNHHPEWCLVGHRVEVVLTTHDACGVTALDLELAQAMNRMARLAG